MISVFYNHVQEAARQQHMTEEEVLKRLGAAGIEGVELGYSEYDGREQLKSRLDAAGFRVSSIYRMFAFENGTDSKAVRELIDEAKWFECKNVMAIPGFIPEGESREEVCSRMLPAMRELTDCASAEGITVLIEDFDAADSPTVDAEGMRYFADHLPELRITFDCGNFYYTGEDELAAFRLLKDRIAHVHCKDRAVSPAAGEKPARRMDGALMYPSPFGDGVIPSGDIFRELRKINYSGWLVIEHFDASDQLNFMLRSAENISGLLR